MPDKLDAKKLEFFKKLLLSMAPLEKI